MKSSIHLKRALEILRSGNEGAVVAMDPRVYRMLQTTTKLDHEIVDSVARKNPVTKDENITAELIEEFGDLCIVAGSEKLLLTK